ncbi:MAG: ISNCY family transposase [Bacilli bacterium]|nr:ISNCY family transposase [Bacilli bacterium]MDD4298090.1 ISNCY family transposase [Bacilli bacterium]
MKGIEFNKMELKKLNIIQSVIDGKRSGKEASVVLHISERQVWRLVNKVKTMGEEGIKHGNKFNKPKHSIPDDLKQKIINLKLSDDYCDTNFSHFRELLEERENIKISYSPLYYLLREADIKSKRKHKDRKIHRRRKRKEYEGDMVQADGTPFDWFKDNNMYSLHGFIDDATGKVLGLYMCENECLLGYLEATRQMLTNHGSPRMIYPDKYSVFFPAKSQKPTLEEELEGKDKPTTQFGRIMDFLGIEMYPASTSQAKGRIERLWETLQDRLITEFKLNNIKTIEQANAFLPKYIIRYNKRFAVQPQKEESKFIQVPSYINLDLLLTSKFNRVIDNSGTFSIRNKKFQILDNKILPNVKVNVYMSKKIGIIVEHNNTQYKVVCIDNLPNKYSTLNLNQFCKDHSLEVINFVEEILTYNAKQYEPLLTTS